MFSFSSDKYPEVVLLDHIILFSVVTAPIYIPINSVQAHVFNEKKMKQNCILQNKLVRKLTLFYTFKNLFTVQFRGPEVHKLWPMSQIQPTAYFCKYKFIVT